MDNTLDIIRNISFVLGIISWLRSAFYMLEMAFELKEKYGISLTSLSYMKKSKFQKYISETPLAKKHLGIYKRNGMYFLICIFVVIVIDLFF